MQSCNRSYTRRVWTLVRRVSWRVHLQLWFRSVFVNVVTRCNSQMHVDALLGQDSWSAEQHNECLGRILGMCKLVSKPAGGERLLYVYRIQRRQLHFFSSCCTQHHVNYDLHLKITPSDIIFPEGATPLIQKCSACWKLGLCIQKSSQFDPILSQ
jgi:hypothetical protein